MGRRLALLHVESLEYNQPYLPRTQTPQSESRGEHGLGDVA